MKIFLALPLLVSFVATASFSNSPEICMLEQAVDNDNVALARIAINRGISPDAAITDEGVTALMSSVELGKVNMIHYLTREAGASISKTDNLGYTPLHFACGPNGSFTGLREYLNVPNVDVNAKELSQGNTPLHFAAVNGSIPHISLLLRAEADLEMQNNIGNTPVIAAAYRDNHLAVGCLIRFGADYLAVNTYDQDCLAVAASKNSMKVARLLLELINPTKLNINTGIIRAITYAATPEMRALLQEYCPATVSVIGRDA